jgi:hypothetical protein
MTVGGLLHALHVPFSGILLAAVGTAILACQRALCPVRGITLTTGCLAAAIKVFSMGGVHLNPLLAEAFLAELVFSVLGAGFLTAGLAGFLMGLWSFAQGLLTLMLLYGMHWIEASVAALSRQAPSSLPLSPMVVLCAAALLLVSLPTAGGVLGFWSARRLRGSVPARPIRAHQGERV